MTIANYIQKNRFIPLEDLAHGLVIEIGKNKLPKIKDGEYDADGSIEKLENGNIYAKSIVMCEYYAVTVAIEMNKNRKLVNKFISSIRDTK